MKNIIFLILSFYFYGCVPYPKTNQPIMMRNVPLETDVPAQSRIAWNLCVPQIRQHDCSQYQTESEKIECMTHIRERYMRHYPQYHAEFLYNHGCGIDIVYNNFPDYNPNPARGSGHSSAYNGGSVHVRGYYRRDGTYVRSYTRR